VRAIGPSLLSTSIAICVVALSGCQSVATQAGAGQPGTTPASAAPADSPAAFLARNAREAGMQSLPGVQYRIVRSGPADGAQPKRSDTVTVNYEGKLLSGEVFDSSYTRGEPVTFPLKPLIPGWVVALQLMRPGDEWIIYVPPEMAYGAQGTGPIPANSVLIFRVELLSVAPTPKTEAAQ
jgi:FKBP-type peptidyl-prolyl cis-trans isomerase